MKILLASNSPRRKELLQQLGFDFEIVTILCEEVYPPETPASEVANYLSQLKASAYDHLKENEILITADTVVALGETILGKPKDEIEAQKMLQDLSERSHTVYTSVTLKTTSHTFTLSDKAEVFFSKITEEEIAFYLETFRPYDKAGSYGIQEWLGMAKISKINGSFYTIMGLPTQIVYEKLKEMGA